MAAAGLFRLDAIVVERVSPSPTLETFVSVIELATGKSVTEFLCPALIMLAGVLLSRRQAPAARMLLYVGGVQLISYLATDLSKPWFGRLRPFEAISLGDSVQWFVGANSFPSGHVAFFAGLTVPIAVLFPRLSVFIAIPLLEGAQRVTVHDHYLSDVAAGLLIASLAAWALYPITRTR